MENRFIKLIGRRPVYPVGTGWNEPSEVHRLETSRNERERQKDEPKSMKSQPGASNNRMCVPIPSK